MTQGKLKIHTENLLPIIKKWLYSDKEIFVRELVSNACDALNKLRILREMKEVEVTDDELRIDLKIDKEKRTLTFHDTGIGMTHDEVEKYIAQVAFSGAEEFVSKYKSQNEQDQIIGHFGLGFYSAYMVATKVEIDTLSYQEKAEAVFWSCDGSADYTIDKGVRAQRGTSITLFIDKESDEFLEESRLKNLLKQYCAFLPFPITLNGEKINGKEPLWLKNPADCSEKEYLDFYHELYPLEAEPIFWIHLNVDNPFNLKGILYFPKIQKRLEWNRVSIKLFCNRVFVSDNCKDLIPEYLTVLQGVLDSPDIPLNVSRSTLQMDKTVRQLASHISKKVSDRLVTLNQTDRKRYEEAWPDIELIVKLGAIQDEKFYERVKGALIWKNTEGSWTTADEYLERNRERIACRNPTPSGVGLGKLSDRPEILAVEESPPLKGGVLQKTKEKIFYTAEEKTPSHLLELYKGHEILVANSPVDTALMNTLENKLQPAKFQRLDGAIEEATLDASREKTLLDADGKTAAAKIADFIRRSLEMDKVEVEAKSLTSDELPGFIVLDEDLRRMRDYMALTGQSLPPSLTDKRTFVVNTNSKLISAICGLQDKKPELAKEMVRHLYDLSLLSQKELPTGALADFVKRSSTVLEKLIIEEIKLS